jgi:radical SAM protein with 4Fe4S-binding SPASM domain
MSKVTELKTDTDFVAGKFPEQISIDLSNKCNLRCRFCHLNFYEPEKWTQLSYDDFLNIAPFLDGVEKISIFSKYEPLTCRDFIPIFNKMCETDIETYFSTNGILLNDEIIDAVVGKLTYLTVSITGFTQESYTTNMGQDRLEKVRENLTKLNAAKKAANTDLPKLRITTVALLDTLDEICMSLDFAAEFEAAEGVRLSYFESHDEAMSKLLPLVSPEAFSKAIDEAAEYAKNIGVKFEPIGGTMDEIEGDVDEELGHRPCGLPWETMSLQPNGDVYPCTAATTTVGNFFENTLEEIWNGEQLAEFRRGVNNPEAMNKDCAECCHCQIRSVLKVESNDWGSNEECFGGSTRIKKQA